MNTQKATKPISPPAKEEIKIVLQLGLSSLTFLRGEKGLTSFFGFVIHQSPFFLKAQVSNLFFPHHLIFFLFSIFILRPIVF